MIEWIYDEFRPIVLERDVLEIGKPVCGLKLGTWWVTGAAMVEA